jgi:hypothetical protein
MQKHLPAHFEPHIPHGSGDAEYRIIGIDGTILAIVDPTMTAEDPAALAEAMVRAMNAAAIEPEPEMPTPGEGEQVYRVRQLADAYLYYWCYVVATSPGEALKIASNEDQDWVEDGSSDAFDNRDYEVYRADDEDYNEILDDSYRRLIMPESYSVTTDLSCSERSPTRSSPSSRAAAPTGVATSFSRARITQPVEKPWYSDPKLYDQTFLIRVRPHDDKKVVSADTERDPQGSQGSQREIPFPSCRNPRRER